MSRRTRARRHSSRSRSKDGKWSGHEAFFVTAPDVASDVPTMELWERYWMHVPIKEGKDLCGYQGFFDCSEAVGMGAPEHGELV